jgi:hypothetical protein
MNTVYKTMLVYGSLATSMLAQTNIDRLFTDEGYWAKSAKAVASELSTYEWDTSADKAVLKNTDIRLRNRDVDGFNMVSRDGYLRSLNVLVDTTKSKPEFSDTLGEWVAILDTKLKVDHTEDAHSGKDGGKSMTYRWKKDTYYVSLTGTAKGEIYNVSLEYRPKVVVDAPARVLAEKDRFDGIYERNFYTPDYSKSFKARIVGFDQGKETISVQTKNATLSVPLDKLSERDLAYYEEIKDLVIASKSLGLSIKESKAKPERKGRATTVNTNFAISLANRSTQPIQELEIKYVAYHKVDTLDGGPVLTSSSGSIDVTSLYGKYRQTLYTDPVAIVRETKPGVSGSG